MGFSKLCLNMLCTALTGSFLVQAQNQCTVGGSTEYCGYKADGSISGGFSSPCSCQSTLCCSTNGFCGPEPTITHDLTSAYCGTGCQSSFGNCSPGPVYFEYIGTGDTPTGMTDTTNQKATVLQVPVPSAAPFYFIIFLLSDQRANLGGGQSTGNFGPVGQFASGSTASMSYWDPTQIGYLSSRASNAKVMASIAGNTGTTKWAGVASVASYVQTATTSLMGYYHGFNLAGFDINYEESIVTSQGTTDPTWLAAWCQIIVNLKKAGAMITFAPYSQTTKAYKDLQQCLAQANTNIDFVIYQVDADPADLATQTNNLTAVQQLYAPTKIIAGVSNGMLMSNPNLVAQLIDPLISTGVISGASVFDADQSLVANPAFKLEHQLFCKAGCH